MTRHLPLSLRYTLGAFFPLFFLTYIHLRRIRTHEHSSILPLIICMSIAIFAFLSSFIEGSFIFISPLFSLFVLNLSTTPYLNTY